MFLRLSWQGERRTVSCKTLKKVILGSVAACCLWLQPFLAMAEGDSISKPVYGGTLRFVVSPEPSSLITFDNTFGATQRIATKVTEGLVSYDFDYQPQPQLATSWDVSDDGLRYTFRLQPGVKWHDGEDFTSEDVAFSIQQVSELQSFGRMTYANLERVETPDPLTVVIVLSKPSGFLLKTLHAAITPIIPKHVYENGPPAQNPHNSRPIGTGPFIFKEWVKGSHVTLERNPHYWDQPKPYLDRIIVRFIPDPSARAAAIEAGEVDIAADNPIPLSDLDRFAKIPGIELEKRGYGFLGSQTQLEFNLRNPILQKSEVRKAIAHAINIERLKDVAWYGNAKLSPTLITVLDRQNHDPSIQPYAYDRKKAAALLDAAGYPAGADGKRFDLRLIYNPYNDGYRRVAEYVRQELSAVGINAVIDARDFAGYVNTVYTEGAFDLNAATHVNLLDPTIGVQRIYWSGNIKKGVAFSNASHYHSETVDALFEAAAVETDADKRRQLFFDIQRIVHEELPIVNFLAVDAVTVSRSQVRNHTLSEYGAIDSFAEVYLAP